MVIFSSEYKKIKRILQDFLCSSQFTDFINDTANSSDFIVLEFV